MLQDCLNNLYITIFAPGWLSGVFWNCVVGLLGIIFTVYFVDRKAKEREDKRWQPAKDNVYYKLFWSLGTMADSLGMTHKWREDEYYYFYYFGVYFIGIFYDVKNIKPQDEKFSGYALEGLNGTTVSRVEEALETIDNLIDNYPQLLEPDLLNLVMRLKERLHPVVTELYHYLGIDPDDREGSIDLQPLAEEICSLFVWLSKRTSKIIKQPVTDKNSG